MSAQSIGRVVGESAEPVTTAGAFSTLENTYLGFARLAALCCGTRFASIAISEVGEGWVGDGEPMVQAPRGAFAFRRESHLKSKSGDPLGTLTVFDESPCTLTSSQLSALELLAAQASCYAELRSSFSDFLLITGARHYAKPQGREPVLAKALIENAPVAIYHTDNAGNMTYSNPEYRRMFGLAIGHGPDAWAERVHPQDRARIQALWADFCAHPRPCRFDGYRTIAADGSVRHFSEQVVRAEGVDGWLGTISDFTELVNVREDLRRAESLYSNTFDQAPIGIVYTDRAGNVLRCNQSFHDMLGLPPQAVPQSLACLTHQEDLARVTAGLAQLWRGNLGVVDLEKRYLRSDGTPLWVRVTTALVREGNAAPQYSVEFVRDISGAKEAEAQFERVHKQLLSASRQAGMAEVATNVLHNVGNILNSVNISASLVTERIKQSKAGGVARVAQLLNGEVTQPGRFIDNDERGRQIPAYLASLGEQLLADQKMALDELASLRGNLEHIKDTVAMQQSYAKLCGVTETVAVEELVEDSLRLNAGAFARHGVTLRKEFAPVPPITVDKHKVLQILVNLVRNAKYACDESGRQEKLLTLRIERSEAGVRIAVLDNGVGIRPEDMPRLFTHGFTTRASGHGFGLHSGALAAQQLGGSLWAQSDGPGCGAAFILELPLEQREDARS